MLKTRHFRIATFATLSALASLLAGTSGCTHEIYEDGEEPIPEDTLKGWGRGVGQALAEAGRWQIPEETLAIGDTQEVEYDGAGPWNNGAACTGGLTAGASVLREHLLAYYPQIESIGGYACRPIVGNSSSLSLHGTGRALDIMIPTIGGEADNTAGDEIGIWLIENAEAMGIQLVIWDRTIWRTSNWPRAKEYTGSHPHHDHLHVEVNENAAALGPPWYDAPFAPAGCPTVPADGKVFEDDDPCFHLFGNPTYWRYEQGTGIENDLYWTNAFESDEPANWARWELNFDEAGEYELKVYVDPAYGVFTDTRYLVKAADGEHVVYLDQGSATGWVSLGAFPFDTEGSQSLAVFDDSSVDVPDNQHIVVDAMKAIPYIPGAPSDDDDVVVPPPSGGSGNGPIDTPDDDDGIDDDDKGNEPDDLTVYPDCETLPASGGIIDDDSSCFAIGGPSEFWRYLSGGGYGGGMYWTEAYEGDAPINWARWTVRVKEAGDYELFAYVDSTYAGFANVPYRIEDKSGHHTVSLDHGASDGFTSLGVFHFIPGRAFSVDLYDNSFEPIVGERTIAVDALQVLRRDDPCTAESCPDDDSLEPGMGGIEVVGGFQLPVGCSQSDGSTFAGLALVLLPLLFRRRSGKVRIYRFRLD